jgi:hypothetical protein
VINPGVFAFGAVAVGLLMHSIKIEADASPQIAARSPGSGDDFSPSRG